MVAADLRAAIIVGADPAQRDQWPLGDRPLPFVDRKPCALQVFGVASMRVFSLSAIVALSVSALLGGDRSSAV